MARASTRRAPSRGALSRETVVRAAVTAADAHGLDALSMRRLAQDLGVEAMSLYHYVKSKDELVTQMVDLVLSEVDLPDPDMDWKGSLRAIALSAREVLRRHRWAGGLMMSVGPCPAQLRRMEAMLGALERAGLSPTQIDQAYHALESHIVGFSLWLASMRFPQKGDLERTAVAFLRTLPEGAFPQVIKHARQHMAPPGPGRKTEFEFGLDLILDGLERLRPASASTARR